MADLSNIKEAIQSQYWRLNNLYWIQDKEGKEVPFKMNWAQDELWRGLWHANIVLKVRQLGCTTFYTILALDNAIFRNGQRCVIVAHKREDAEEIFRTKVKFPWEHIAKDKPALRQSILRARTLKSDTGKRMVFDNDSSILVSTSGRSGTATFMVVTEYGKICAKYPDKAREVRTGSLNTVAKGGVRVIESTAEGEDGDFKAKCDLAQSMQRMKQELGPMDYRFFFLPWWKHPEYTYSGHVTLTPDDEQYFSDVEKKIGQVLSYEQKKWYVKKREEQDTDQDSITAGDMFREYPSTADEAFKAAVEGAYFAKQIAFAEAQGRIGSFPWRPELPVHTSWDLGWDDFTTIWFFQEVGHQIHFIDYHESNNEELGYYANVLSSKPYRYGRHWAPHDANNHSLQTGKTNIEVMRGHGVRWEVNPRMDLIDGINVARRFMARSCFDEVQCRQGIKALKNYQAEFDEARGVFKTHPLRNDATHGASAYKEAAVGFKPMTTARNLPTTGGGSNYDPLA